MFTVELVRRWYDYWRERPGTGRRVSSGGAKIIFSDSNTHYRGEENYRRSGVTDPMRIEKDGADMVLVQVEVVDALDVVLHLNIDRPVRADQITIRLKGSTTKEDAFGQIVEVAAPVANELDLFKANVSIHIHSILFY